MNLIDQFFNNRIVVYISKRNWLLVLVWTAIGLSVYIPFFYNEKHSIIGSMLLVAIIPIFVGWFVYLLYIPYCIIKFLLKAKRNQIKSALIDSIVGVVKLILFVAIGTLSILFLIIILRGALKINGAY
jgi:hypothetical protein